MIKVCWLSGSYFYRKNILDKIKSSQDNYIYYKFLDNFTIDNVKNIISQIDIFEQKKIVICIYEIPYSDSPAKSLKEWTNLFNTISDNTLIVVNNVSPESRSALYKIAEQTGKVFNFDSLNSYENIEPVLSKYISNHNKIVEKEYLDRIFSYYKNDKGLYDVDRIFSSVYKILASNKSKDLKQEDLYKYCSVVKPSIWNFIDNIENKNLELVLKQAKILFQNKNDIESFLNLYLWRKRLTLAVLSSSDINSIHQIKKNKRQGIKLDCSYKKEEAQLFSYYSCKSILEKKLENGQSFIRSISNEEVEISIKNIVDLIFLSRNTENLILSVMYLFFMVECKKLDNNIFEEFLKI